MSGVKVCRRVAYTDTVRHLSMENERLTVKRRVPTWNFFFFFGSALWDFVSRR